MNVKPRSPNQNNVTFACVLEDISLNVLLKRRNIFLHHKCTTCNLRSSNNHLSSSSPNFFEDHQICFPPPNPPKKKNTATLLGPNPGFFRNSVGISLHLLEAVHKLLTSLTPYFFKGTLHGLRSVRREAPNFGAFGLLRYDFCSWFLLVGLFWWVFVVGCGHWTKKMQLGLPKKKNVSCHSFPRFVSAICFSGLHLLARLLCLPKGGSFEIANPKLKGIAWRP